MKKALQSAPEERRQWVAFLRDISSPVRAAAANLLLPFLPCNCSQPNPPYLFVQSSPHFIALYRTWRQSGIHGFYTAAACPDLTGPEWLLKRKSDAKIIPRHFKWTLSVHSSFRDILFMWLGLKATAIVQTPTKNISKSMRCMKTISFNHVGTLSRRCDVLEVNHEHSSYNRFFFREHLKVEASIK